MVFGFFHGGIVQRIHSNRGADVTVGRMVFGLFCLGRQVIFREILSCIRILLPILSFSFPVISIIMQTVQIKNTLISMRFLPVGSNDFLLKDKDLKKTILYFTV